MAAQAEASIPSRRSKRTSKADYEPVLGLMTGLFTLASSSTSVDCGWAPRGWTRSPKAPKGPNLSRLPRQPPRRRGCHRDSQTGRAGVQVDHFPPAKTLEDFDLRFQPSIDQKLVRELAPGRFVAHAENILVFGPPGVGRLTLTSGSCSMGSATCPSRSAPRVASSSSCRAPRARGTARHDQPMSSRRGAPCSAMTSSQRRSSTGHCTTHAR